MLRTNKLNTGTSKYLNDLLLSLYYKSPIGRLVGVCQYRFENRKLTSSLGGLLAEGMNDHTKHKKMLIKFGNEGIKIMLEIRKNKIIFYKDRNYREHYEIITNKNDYFNLLIEHPINITYEDLLNLQITFRKVIKRRNITIIHIPYILGEENYYGY